MGDGQYWERVAALYSAEIDRIRNLMDSAFSRGARSSNAPEDKVVFPLLVVCRGIVEEILFAIKDGFGRAALRATRTMYECVVAARYISLHPEKAEDFLAIFHVEWAKMFQDIPAQFRNLQIDTEIGAFVLKYSAGKRVGLQDLKWSDSQVADMAKDAGALAELHPLAFTLASAYIHPGALFLVSQMSMTSDGVFHIDEKPQDGESAFAMRSGHDLLMNAVDLRLKYSPSAELKVLFEICKTDFERIWGYEPHI
jgi:hypothetical protein